MFRFGSAAVALAATLVCAGTAQAGQVLRVDDGKASIVRDRLLPSAKRTALPPVPQHTRIARPAILARVAALPPGQQK